MIGFERGIVEVIGCLKTMRRAHEILLMSSYAFPVDTQSV